MSYETDTVWIQKFSAFNEFMESKRVSGKHDFTHTYVGDNPTGKYYIATGIEQQKFLELYSQIAEKTDLTLSEKQQEVGPLMTDYDFKFTGEYKERIYAIGDIERVVKIINKLIHKYLDIKTDNIVAYVTEKKHPSIKYEKDSTEDEPKINCVKDGFHICYIIPLTVNQRLFIYDKLKEIAEDKDIFKHLPTTNNYDEILDISTIHRNNWMMYCSRKKFTYDQGKLYQLTHVYNYDMTEESVEQYTIPELVHLFSVRQFDEDDNENIRDEFVDEFNIFSKKTSKKKDSKSESPSLSDEKKPIHSNCKLISSNVEMARKLTQILSVKRANGYEDWSRVGWALRSVDDSLYDDFIEFSQKDPKFDRLSCNRIWTSKKKDGITIASLYWWAQKDNPEKYKEIMKASLENLFVRAEEGTSTDIAQLIYSMYPHNFKCTSLNSKNLEWYEFRNHRWHRMEGAISIRPIITDEIATALEVTSSRYLGQKDINQNDKDIMNKKAIKIMSVCKQLRETGKINNIITECSYKYYDEGFDNKIDSNTNLIGFNNGVYDLENRIFRAGVPEDFVSKTVGFDYTEFTGNEPVFDDIMNFFSKTHTNENIRDYLMRLIAGYLDGRNRDQEFVFWTGSGCHSADTPILMYNGTIKCARDIGVGDQLMGDDSQPRNVRTLFTGVQDMYIIRLSDDSTMTVNANHRLALKSMFHNDVYYDINSKTYIAEYHKSTSDGPIKMTKYFPVDENNDRNVLQSALNYIAKKETRTDTIRYETIIPITVMNYIRLPEEIKKNYVCYRNTVDFQSRSILCDAYKLGKSLKAKHIPSAYMFNSRIVREKTLSGILDTFGHIINDNVYIDIEDSELMNDTIFLCRTLGYHVDIINLTRIMIVGKFKNMQCNFLKFDINQERDHDLTYSFTVENIGRGQFYGFAVDKNERYILQNCIVTYNSNGKSLTTKLIKKALGDYYSTLEHTVITRPRTGSSNATPELADKRGVRFVVMQEPEENDKIHAAFMKQLSGEDDINVRALFKNGFSYTPQFKLILICNNIPRIDANDGGTWRRVRVVPFYSEFVDYPPIKPNQFPMDKEMVNKMKEWHVPFIWLLLNKYYPEWKLGIRTPKEVMLATDTYRKRCDMYSDFIKSSYTLTKSDSDTVSVIQVYEAFKSWYKESFSRNDCPSRVTFLDNLNKTLQLENDSKVIKKLKCIVSPISIDEV